MKLSSKLAKNSFEICTNREAAAVVLVGFQKLRCSMAITYCIVAYRNAGFALVQ